MDLIRPAIGCWMFIGPAIAGGPETMNPFRRIALFLGTVILSAFLAFSPAEAAGKPPRKLAAESLERSLELVRTEPMGGDLDEILRRRMVRVLVVHSRTFYFFDGARPRGITAEMLNEFEKFLNAKFKTGKKTPISVLPIPVRRDELIPRLADGFADIAVANLTITPERKERVDFSIPLITGVSELVVTGPTAPRLSKLEDLAGREVHVRPSSSYYESLKRLNERFRKEGLREVILHPVDERLEDEDILEMINAGLFGIGVVDSHKVTLWAQVFDNVVVHPDLAVSAGDEIGWAVRKETPKLREVVDEFLRTRVKGKPFGLELFRRYYREGKWVRNARADEDERRFRAVVDHFRQYGNRFDLDYLLLTAQGYQESRLDPKARNPSGAVGIMQIKPSTAAGPPISIRNVHHVENNIHAGAKYIRFIIDQYYGDEAMSELDKMLFAFASYNAGPSRIDRVRKKAARQGLDPNVWIGSVDLVAAREIGQETVRYVSNIFKYYLAYKMMMEDEAAGE
jgi:membrane-bound lytic murein transglycosylase MltF